MTTKSASKVLANHFFIIALTVAVLIFVAQFAVLATLGSKGSEVTSVRQQKDELRIENERIRAEIDSTRTLSQVEESIDEVFGMNARRITPEQIEQYQLDSTDSVGVVIDE